MQLFRRERFVGKKQSTGQPHGSVAGALRACRWNFARLFLALAVLALLMADLPGALHWHWAWNAYRSLPLLDYVAHAQQLASADRYEEALACLEEALVDPNYGPAHATQILALRQELQEQQASWKRRLREFAWGALVGSGASPEALAGAMVTDFFVVGDARDLAVQSWKWITRGDGDPVIAVLAGMGVASTLFAAADWAPSLLKAARKQRVLSDRMAEWLWHASRQGGPELQQLLGDIATVRKQASGATVMTALRHADDPADLARVARYAQRSGRSSVFAIHRLEADALDFLRRYPSAEADEMLRLAARKGLGARQWLKHWGPKLLRPHPIRGFVKGWYKGNLSAAAEWLAPRLRESLPLLLPAVLAWVGCELLLFVRRWRQVRPRWMLAPAPV